MPRNIPERKTVACENSDQAVMITAMANANARRQKTGVNLETTFPEGRMHLVIGEITVSVSQPKLRKPR